MVSPFITDFRPLVSDFCFPGWSLGKSSYLKWIVKVAGLCVPSIKPYKDGHFGLLASGFRHLFFGLVVSRWKKDTVVCH
ncbi:Adenylosuccinate lyase (fragment) [Syntrophaceticus schinkii]|uniref:Adenylosuccinate lyase n=1 Tax=Syntrophaceticus schinkii TaxID=499207 RepID=A0A0B7MI47_9FIRM